MSIRATKELSERQVRLVLLAVGGQLNWMYTLWVHLTQVRPLRSPRALGEMWAIGEMQNPDNEGHAQIRGCKSWIRIQATARIFLPESLLVATYIILFENLYI